MDLAADPQHRARFDANFHKAANNITEIGESSAIDSIRQNRDVYYGRFDSFIANPISIKPFLTAVQRALSEGRAK